MKAGDRVLVIVDGAGCRTTEWGTVLRVDEVGVWLDGGPGNKPLGCYNKMTGRPVERSRLGLRLHIAELPDE